MTFLEIEAFLSIAETGNFTTAAEKLFITQPALGRRIKTLEEELGYPLFVRRKGVRRATLTRQGEAFVSLAQRWQALWKETQEASLLGNAKSFYVGSVSSLVAFVLPPVFRQFMQQEPDCTLHVTIAHSSEAYSYVAGKRTDLSFITDPLYSTQVDTCFLFREKLCLVIGDALRQKKVLSLSDLDPSREILTQWDQGFIAWHDYYFSNSSGAKIHLDEMAFLEYFMLGGENWAFMPMAVASAITKHTPSSIHRLRDVQPPERSVYCLSRHGDESPYQAPLLALCRKRLSQMKGVSLTQKE